MQKYNKLTVALLLSLTVPLATAARGEGKPLTFSHQLHIEEAELGCDTCHAADPKVASGMGVKREACNDCHDELPAFALPAKHQRLNAAFPHRPHTEALDCADCHDDIAEDKIQAGQSVQKQSDCVRCHRENGVVVAKNRCAACHDGDARKLKPADHRKTWTRRHGQVSRWRVFNQHSQDCQLCHSERACQSCHQLSRPSDHNGLWRSRMHGSAASWDRDRCKTCHETGSCTSCHRSSSPPSHRGDWAGRHGKVAGGFDNNCTVCHKPASCTACHRKEQ